MSGPTLSVEGLTMHYSSRAGEVKAVDDVSFTLERGQVLGLVGESGCGKTSVGISLMKLLPDNARVLGGRVLLDGVDLLELSEEEIRPLCQGRCENVPAGRSKTVPLNAVEWASRFVGRWRSGSVR